MRSRLEKLSKEKETTQGAFKELQSRFNALNDEIVAVEEEKAKQLRAMRETTREGGCCLRPSGVSFFSFSYELAVSFGSIVGRWERSQPWTRKRMHCSS